VIEVKLWVVQVPIT